jgi:uncharacterized protein YeaO (DUF488 family)
MILSIKTKSSKEYIDKSADGLRILLARFRPRYLPKDKEKWDQWCKELAPSRELWKKYVKDKKNRFAQNTLDYILRKSKTIFRAYSYSRLYLFFY